MATIFVAGATGVVGRRAIPLLTAAGHRVTAVARSPDRRAFVEQLGATGVAVDLFDADAVRRAVAGHDVVINLATHIPASNRVLLPGAWRENDRLRGQGASNLAQAARAAGAGRYIQESFAPVYPDSGDRWIDERVAILPARYNRSVRSAEVAAERVGQDGATAVILRFAVFYGADSDFTRDLVRSVKRGRALVLGRPGAFLSSVSHDDAATAVVAALGVPAGVYNVADDEPLRRREFVDSLAQALAVPPPRLPPVWARHLLGSLGETLARSLRISNRKLREQGWAPRYASVREGWAAVLR